jgi:peptide/nickel transport system substrate-binding protein
MGWNVEVVADSQALTKLSAGSLAVWAAAWGSTIDPDMYQVYHKNSTATSVYAWGYREIKSNQTLYREENRIINELSELIDDGRATMVKADRTEIYENAMRLVLELAVEMPVYQRKTLYAYNTNTIKGLNDNVNPYSTPLEKIWEMELVK